MSNRQRRAGPVWLAAFVLIVVTAVFFRRVMSSPRGPLPSSHDTREQKTKNYRQGTVRESGGSEIRTSEEKGVSRTKHGASADAAQSANQSGKSNKPRRNQQPQPGGQTNAIRQAGNPDNGPEILPDQPLSATAQLHNLVRRAKTETGPEAIDMGNQLLKAGEPLLRAAGAAILSEADALDAAKLDAIAADADRSVPMNVLGWLRDTGRGSLADSLYAQLRKQGMTSDAIIALINSGSLTGSGSRTALDMVSAGSSLEQAEPLYTSLSANQALDYAVRMKATLLLRDTMDFTGYRNEVNGMASTATDEDPLWKEGISRLAKSIEGPAQIHEATPALVPSDIDEMLAREYPMMLEDIALRIEYVISHEGCRIKKGTAERLTSQLKKLQELPWSPEQQVSLRRLESAASQLPALEQEGQPPNLSPPPPGTEE